MDFKTAPTMALLEELLDMAKRTAKGEDSFGRRMAKIRRAKGLSQYDLASELGISQRMVAYYEAQGQRPPAHLLPKIAEVLRASADELLGIKPAKARESVGRLRLWRKLRQIETLPPTDQRALLKMLNALLAARKSG